VKSEIFSNTRQLPSGSSRTIEMLLC